MNASVNSVPRAPVSARVIEDVDVGISAIANVVDDLDGLAEVIAVAPFVAAIEKDTETRTRSGRRLVHFLEREKNGRQHGGHERHPGILSHATKVSAEWHRPEVSDPERGDPPRRRKSQSSGSGV